MNEPMTMPCRDIFGEDILVSRSWSNRQRINGLPLTEGAVDGGYGASHLAVDEQDGRKLRISYAPDQETPIRARFHSQRLGVL